MMWNYLKVFENDWTPHVWTHIIIHVSILYSSRDWKINVINKVVYWMKKSIDKEYFGIQNPKLVMSATIISHRQVSWVGGWNYWQYMWYRSNDIQMTVFSWNLAKITFLPGIGCFAYLLVWLYQRDEHTTPCFCFLTFNF